MSELDNKKQIDFENPDDPNLVRQGNPPDIKSPPTCEDKIDEAGYCIYCCKPKRYCNCDYQTGGGEKE